MSDERTSCDTLKRKAEEAVSVRHWDEAELSYRSLCGLLEKTPSNARQFELAMALHQLAFVLDAQGKTAEAFELRERTSEILLKQRKDT